MKIIRILSLVGSAAAAQAAYAEMVGTVLFAQEGAQIVGASGAVRPARRGDVIQAGEQLSTSATGISQIKLSDGSLVGVRPGSQLRMDPAAASGQSMSLLQGGVRIIGGDLMNRGAPSNVTLRTGQAVLQLNGADLESMVVHPMGRPDAEGRPQRPGEPQPPRSGDPGSYNRLIAGTGQVRSGTAVEPLVARQVSFVPAGNAAPVQLAAMPPAPFPDRAPVPGGAPMPGGPAGRPQVGPGVPDGARPPLPGALPPGPPAGQGPLAGLSPMTSTLTAPQFQPAGPAVGMPLPGAPRPNFSPIATAPFPDGPKGPAPAMPPIPAGIGGPGNMKPMGPPPNLRPPPICTPSPLPGKPPICK